VNDCRSSSHMAVRAAVMARRTDIDYRIVVNNFKSKLPKQGYFGAATMMAKCWRTKDVEFQLQAKLAVVEAQLISNPCDSKGLRACQSGGSELGQMLISTDRRARRSRKNFLITS
jgi:hypothetical protein